MLLLVFRLFVIVFFLLMQMFQHLLLIALSAPLAVVVGQQSVYDKEQQQNAQRHPEAAGEKIYARANDE